ncbi:MAG: LacI family DNA-binding transcriptional regulator [Pseudomonadota bacterium]|nr:LacI family DNA-binding transcriptional regulator [Pseudomonadota bacterium]
MKARSRKARLEDIAKHAGVGLATVDRVLNERGGVSERTAARVLDSARQLGTNRILPTGKWRQLSIEAVFARNATAYSERLNRSLAAVNKLVDYPVTIYRTHIDADEPERLVAHLDAAADSRDGIILFASDLPVIARAVAGLVSRTFIVTISTDISDSRRHCYVGIDNVNAGRSAAKLSEAICRKGGRVLVVEPGTNARSNLDRIKGFSQFFADRGIEDKLTLFSPRNTTSEAVSDMLAILSDQNEFRVVYGPANNALLETLIESGRDEDAFRSLAKIVHDLSPHAIDNLRSGLIDMVIDSNPMQQAFQAVDFIARQHGYETDTTMSAVDFQLYTSENLPRTGNIL